LALLLPLAAFLFFKKSATNHDELEIAIIIRNLVLAGIIAFLTFPFSSPIHLWGRDSWG
jgi:hypothetical protein